jgi:hypothetical protein
MRKLAAFPLLAITACSSPGGPYPSLQARSAEAIDPRLPVDRPMNDRPVSAALAGQLHDVIGRARSGAAAFDAAAAEAERLTAGAGAPHSEGWIAAEQALSAAVAARRPVALALGDVDAMAANALAVHAGIAPHDLAAIQSAAADIGAIDAREAARISAMQQRLGS